MKQWNKTEKKEIKIEDNGGNKKFKESKLIPIDR